MSNIKFDIFCRHELVPILMALQHLYFNKPVLYEILDLIKEDIVEDKDERLGCFGMHYWEILVLASVRLGCDLNYDALHDLANNHATLRDIMQISRLDDQRFPRTTIHDNITKLSPKTIFKISDIIIAPSKGRIFCTSSYNMCYQKDFGESGTMGFFMVMQKSCCLWCN